MRLLVLVVYFCLYLYVYTVDDILGKGLFNFGLALLNLSDAYIRVKNKHSPGLTIILVVLGFVQVGLTLHYVSGYLGGV